MRLPTLALSTATVLLMAAGAVRAENAPAPATPTAPAIPVSVAKVARRDVPVLINGLGTVQANYSVLLRTQVDGKLLRVPVTEGQDVRKGDILAEIDPRPYQAALDAALAKKQQDEALLANARADLARYTALARRDFASRQQVDTQQAQVNQYIAAIAGDAAGVETAQVNLGFCAITAPFDGRVGLRTRERDSAAPFGSAQMPGCSRPCGA